MRALVALFVLAIVPACFSAFGDGFAGAPPFPFEGEGEGEGEGEFDEECGAARALFPNASGGGLVELVEGSGTIELDPAGGDCPTAPGEPLFLVVAVIRGSYTLEPLPEQPPESLPLVRDDALAVAVGGDAGARFCTSGTAAVSALDGTSECDGFNDCFVVCATCLFSGGDDFALQVFDDTGEASNAICLDALF